MTNSFREPFRDRALHVSEPGICTQDSERVEFTRIVGIPGSLVKRWSKRREKLEKQAAAMG